MSVLLEKPNATKQFYLQTFDTVRTRESRVNTQTRYSTLVLFCLGPHYKWEVFRKVAGWRGAENVEVENASGGESLCFHMG